MNSDNYEEYTGWVYESVVHKVLFNSAEEMEDFINNGNINWDNAKHVYEDIDKIEITDKSGEVVY